MGAIPTVIFIKGILTILLSVGIFFLAATFHERSHWLVSRIWSEDLSIIRKFGLFPASVDFGSPFDIPSCGMRIVGIAPFLFCLPTAVVLFMVLDSPFLIRVLLTLPFWAASILSPSDLLAFFYPERFQAIAANNESIGHFETIRILADEFRS